MKSKQAKIPIRKFRGRYYFLSNFHISMFLFEGEIWKTAEHAFQACKASNPAERRWIRDADTPAEAKARGHAVALPINWDEVKEDCMYQVLRAKFQVPELQEQLVATAPRKLVEGNKHGDTYWGKVQYRGKWVGKNRLGKLLMVLRDDLMLDCDHD